MAKAYNKTKKDFTQISNKLLTDKNLSFGARGLMGLMLSRPESWEFNMKEISSNTNESSYAVQKLMKELSDKRYILRLKRGVSGEKSKFEWLYFLNEIPFTDEDIEELEKEYLNRKSTISNDYEDLPQSQNATMAKCDDGNLGLYSNTELYNNTELYKNKDTYKKNDVSPFGINKKGFQNKDKWEKFLDDNLSGINYNPLIEKSISKLEKIDGEVNTKKYLLETFQYGIDNNLDINIVGNIIANGTRVEKKKNKPKELTKNKTAEIVSIKKKQVLKEEIVETKSELIEIILTPELEEKAINILIEKHNFNLNTIENMKKKSEKTYKATLKQALRDVI